MKAREIIEGTKFDYYVISTQLLYQSIMFKKEEAEEEAGKFLDLECVKISQQKIDDKNVAILYVETEGLENEDKR